MKHDTFTIVVALCKIKPGIWNWSLISKHWKILSYKALWVSIVLCGSRKYPYPGRGVSLKILRGKVVGWVVLKGQNLQKKVYKAKNAIFKGVGGSNQKAPQGESMEV